MHKMCCFVPVLGNFTVPLPLRIPESLCYHRFETAERESSMLPKLIVIEGTNASGKSSLGISLAARYGGEIVSADSRQVFRRMDLGSGKVTREEMNGVPHHLLDVCDPGEFFSMADFQRLAYEAIDGILSRGAVPFLVGGTGLYVDAVADGYELSDKSPDHGLRMHLETFDTPALFQMLKEKRCVLMMNI